MRFPISRRSLLASAALVAGASALPLHNVRGAAGENLLVGSGGNGGGGYTGGGGGGIGGGGGGESGSGGGGIGAGGNFSVSGNTYNMGDGGSGAVGAAGTIFVGAVSPTFPVLTLNGGDGGIGGGGGSSGGGGAMGGGGGSGYSYNGGGLAGGSVGQNGLGDYAGLGSLTGGGGGSAGLGYANQAGGGGAPVVTGSGAQGGGTGGVAGSGGLGAIGVSSFTAVSDTYSMVGIGGGGGGGGWGNSGAGNGGNGTSGTLTLGGGVTLTVTRSLLLGGAGGGAGGYSGYPANGGAGGAGTLAMSSGSVLKIAGTLLVGGSGGGGTGGLNNGGAGGAGILNLSAGARIEVADALIVGGNSGTGFGGAGGAGTINVSGTIAFTGAGAGMLAINSGGTINLTAAAALDIAAGKTVTTTVASGGKITGGGSLTKTGAGVLILSGVHDYTGPTVVTAGTLKIGGAGTVLGANSALTLNSGATLDLAGFDLTAGSLAGAGNVSLGAAALSVGADNTSTTFSGIVSGGGRVTKQGSGTLTLSGNNTYSGGTRIEGGAISVASLANLGTGGLTLAGGALSATGGGAVLNGDLIVTAAGGALYSAGPVTQIAGSILSAGILSIDAGASDILLTSAGNSFGGALSLKGKKASVTSSGSLLLDGVDALALTVNAAGTLTQTGSLATLEKTTLSASAITLTNAGNTFTGTRGVDGANGGNKTAAGADGTGGSGGANFGGSGDPGGTGGSAAMNIVSGNLINLSGTFTGGAGGDGVGTAKPGGAGGGGVALNIASTASGADVTLTSATLAGGKSGATPSYSEFYAGTGGGAGVWLQATGTKLTVASTTTVTGGEGTSGSRGGAGVIAETGATITNAGVIAGGKGGDVSSSVTGRGGDGVIAVGDTLVVNSGEIRGGLSGSGPGGSQGAAVNFSGGGNTLELRAGATFSGAIVSTSGSTGGGDTLRLGGDTNSSGGDSFAVGSVSGFTVWEKSGAGMWALTGIGSASQNWTVSGGVLKGDSASFAGDIVDNATVTFAQNTDGTYSGVISGTGILMKEGSGNVTLSGVNTYSGGTTIRGGTLTVISGSGTAGTGAIAIDTAGTLGVVTAAGPGNTLDYTLVGSGTLSVSGPEKLTLAGDVSAFTGTMAITTPGLLTGTDIHAATIALGTGSTLESTVASGNTATISGAITGAGAFLQSGSGTTLLSGTSTYTGGTVVNAGTLAANGASSFGTGTVVVNSGGTLRVDTTTSGTTSLTLDGGAVTGPGTFNTGDIELRSGTAATSLAAADASTVRKTGAGTVTLSADNTFVGGLTIEAGTLVAESAGALGSGTVTVNTGATLTANVDLSGLSTLVLDGGTLDGAGSITTGVFDLRSGNVGVAVHSTGASVISVGTGDTLVVTGDLTGFTTVSLLGGTLSGTGNIAADTFDLREGTASVVLTGTGSLVKTTAGTVVLTQANDYAGGTTILAGTLSVTDPGALGSGAVTLTAGTLAADFAGDATWTHDFTGAGALVKNGAGTLTLSGNHGGFTGVTSVTDGTLVVSSGSVSDGAYSAATGTTVRFTGATLNHDLSGAGTYELSGNNTFSGAKTGTGVVAVQAGGSLDLGGDALTPTSLAFSQITVLAGSRLTGSGSFGTLVNNGGIIAPGHSPGTIVLAGDFVSTGGSLEIEIAGAGAGQFDRIEYDGHATVNGTALNIVYLGGFVPVAGQTFAFLVDTNPDGTPVAGSGFAPVNLPALTAGLGSRLVITDAGASIEIYRTSLAALAGFSPHDGLSGFVAATPLNGAAFDAIVLAGTSGGPAALNAAIQNASPIGFSAIDALVIDENRQTADWLRDRAQTDIRTLTDSWNAFVETHGAITDWDDERDTGTFDQNVFGGKAGFARIAAPGVAVGVALGYDSGTANLHAGGGKIEQDRGSVTAYIAHEFGGAAFAYAGLTGGYSSFDTRRDTVTGREDGGTHGLDLGVSAGFGYKIKLGETFDTVPYAGLTYTLAHTDGFTESGGALAVLVEDRDTESLRFKLGDDLGWTTPVGAGKLRIAIGVAFEHEVLDDDTAIRASFVNGSGDYSVRGQTLSRNILSVGPSLAWLFTENQSVSAGYDYEYGLSGTDSHRFNVAYTARF